MIITLIVLGGLLALFLTGFLIDKLIEFIDIAHWGFKSPVVGEYYVRNNYEHRSNLNNPFEKYNWIKFARVEEIENDWVLYSKYERLFGENTWTCEKGKTKTLKGFKEEFDFPCEKEVIKIKQIIQTQGE